MPLIASTPVPRMAGPYPKRWAALFVLCLSLLIVVMANTSLIVAAPDLTRDLGLDASQLQWVIDAYTVPYAALMLMLGAVGDKYSRRGGLVTGLLIFGAGSVMGSLVHQADAVIAARAVMGIGAALIMPATLSLLVATFPRSERAKAITAWSATSGLAIALGPLLAGRLLENHAWGSTFLINVPVAAVAIVLAMALVPPSRAEGRGRIDVVGGLLSVVTVGALVYAVIEGARFGWTGGPLAGAIAAALGLAAFVPWELRHPRPILDVRKFRIRSFSGSMIAVLMFFFGTFGALYYSTQHLQFVLGYSPLDTGIRLLPLAGAVFVGAAVTGRLTPRLGVKPMVVAGMAVGTAGVLLLMRIDPGSGYTDFVAPFALLGFAIGLSVSPCTDTIMEAFPEHDLGVGGATNDTALELGGALGIAILGSVLNTTYRDRLTDAVAGKLPGAALDTAKDSIGGALGVAEHIAHSPQGGPTQAQALVSAAHQSFADAVAHTSLIGGIAMAVGTGVVALVMPSAGRSSSEQEQPGRVSATDTDTEPDRDTGETQGTAHGVRSA
ncbi:MULTISPECIES: MFS transporter [Streptacidiphilus]|uniref:MFS transporter n=1 Tax=Streptacidiphilus cavernicola TaxID=3342716 RepID=A0ABV6V168_9ACTN|nr:MFS transporter [Streptacidiphilus jeojiense]